jgi:hypothetical protein
MGNSNLSQQETTNFVHKSSSANLTACLYIPGIDIYSKLLVFRLVDHKLVAQKRKNTLFHACIIV